MEVIIKECIGHNFPRTKDVQGTDYKCSAVSWQEVEDGAHA